MTGLVFIGSEISRERSARRVVRHRHLAPYAAVVLRGAYVEAGDGGRFEAVAGDVLFHEAFEAHQDQFASSGADILNIPLPAAHSSRFARVADPDEIVRLVANDPAEAPMRLLEALIGGRQPAADWPDQLAEDLRTDIVTSLAAWAGSRGLAPSSVSRGFRFAYGVSPQRYRADFRAARAARLFKGSNESFTAIAADAGFADQAHMNRAVRHCFGHSPTTLRNYVKSVQAGADPRR